MAKTKTSKSKSAEPKKKDSVPKISEDKVAKPLKPSKTAFKKAKIAEKLAKKERQQAQDDDIPDLLKGLLNTAGESTSATATSTDDNEAAKAAAPITTTAQKCAAESADCESFSSSSDSESDSDSDFSSSSEDEKPAAKKPKTDEVKSTTVTNTTSDLFYVDVAPSEASVNRKARQRLELIAKMKEKFQKAWNVSVGSTEPHEGVDKALEEWIEKYDRTQAKVEWDLRLKKRMRAAKQIRNIEERKAAIHSLAQEKRNPNLGIGFRLNPEKTNAERKAEKKKRKAKKVKKPKANYGSRT